VITPSVYQENVFIHSLQSLTTQPCFPTHCNIVLPPSISSICLRLLPLSPITSILPSTFPSKTCCRRQLLHKMWPIWLAFHLFTVRRILFYPLTLCNISSLLTRSVQLIFCSTTFQNLSGISDLLSEVSQVLARHKAMLHVQEFTRFFLKFKSNLLVQRAFFLSNAAFAMEILDFISGTSCIICYHATQAVEIFHIQRLFIN